MGQLSKFVEWLRLWCRDLFSWSGIIFAEEIANWNPKVRCIDSVSKLLKRCSFSFLGNFWDFEGFPGICHFKVGQKRLLLVWWWLCFYSLLKWFFPLRNCHYIWNLFSLLIDQFWHFFVSFLGQNKSFLADVLFLAEGHVDYKTFLYRQFDIAGHHRSLASSPLSRGLDHACGILPAHRHLLHEAQSFELIQFYFS